MNTEDFVTYEQALALQKLGFREKCLYYYAKIFDEYKIQNNYEYASEVDEIITVTDLYASHNSIERSPVIDAPTLAQVQKWLRNKKKILIDILSNHPASESWCAIINDLNNHNNDGNIGTSYDSYEEALSAGITECLKLLEK